MTRPSRTPRLALTLCSLAVVGVIVAACAAGGSDAGSDTTDATSTMAPADKPQNGSRRQANDQAQVADGLATTSSLSSFDLAQATSGETPAAPPPQPDSLSALVIRTGAVALSADDVDQARFDVLKIVAQHAGQVTEEETRTNDDGDVKTSLMVLRIPSADFAEVMSQLEKVADLQMSTSNSEDVTTKVIDNQVRIRVERRSIARIQTLLDRARTIRDIVRIESQLTRRQANLNSTLRRQAYLRDQTSLSTISVALERTKDQAVAQTVHAQLPADTSGFSAGLNTGWHKMTIAAVGIATLAGVSLPWLVVLLLLAPFAWFAGRPVVRRLRALRAPEPEAAA
jgi:hypothetical protein